MTFSFERCPVLRITGFLIWALSGLGVFAQGTTTWTLTFDGPPTIYPQEIKGFSKYDEQGMRVTAIGPIPTEPPYYIDRAGGGIPGFPENGSVYLIAPFQGSLSVNSLSGLPFSAVSVDLAEYSTLFAFPTAVEFYGYRRDGSVVSQQFTTDGIMDGTGPLADFQTFYFDAKFTDLTRVEVPTYGWALDNFVFAQVPEPQTLSLLVVGGVALWFQRKAKQRR